MRYQRPEVVCLSSAVSLIQNPMDKEVQQIIDTPDEALGSAAAYAADE